MAAPLPVPEQASSHADPGTEAWASVFISYSRKDGEFARKLAGSLKERGLEYWIDWEDIPPGVDWQKEIEEAIEGTDVFLSLLSPDSIASEMCQREIQYAAQNNKRRIPIVVRDIDRAVEGLSHLNYIFARENDDFDAAFEKLKAAIQTDFEWVKQHKRLQGRALEWKRNQEDPGSLLRGTDLQNAEILLARNSSREPLPTDEQHEYVLKSRQELDRQRRRNTWIWRIVTVTLSVLFLASSFLAWAAWKSAVLAQARLLSTQARYLIEARSSQQQTAILLAIRSAQLAPEVEALQILQTNTLATQISRIDTKGRVSSVAFSPKQDLLAIGSYDGKVWVSEWDWDTGTGREVAQLEHESIVNEVIFSPDGRYVASSSYDGTVRLLDISTRKEAAPLAKGMTVYSVMFSTDSRYLLFGTCEEYDEFDRCVLGAAYTWDVNSGKEIAHMMHGDGVEAIAFSPDGRYAASGSCDEWSIQGEERKCLQGSARIWEASTGREIHRMIHDDYVSSLAFSPDGSYIVSGSWDSTARVWDPLTGKEISRMDTANIVYSVAVSPPDGKYVAVGAADNSIRVWESRTGKEVARMFHDETVEMIAYDPQGRYIISASQDHTARVWDALTGDEVARMTHEDRVYWAAFSSDGSHAASGSEDNTARVWQIDPPGLQDVSAILPKTKYKLTYQCEKKNAEQVCIRFFWSIRENASGHESARISTDYFPGGAQASSDGRYLALLDEKSIHLWEIGTDREIRSLELGDHVSSYVFSPDGKRIVSGSWDGTVRVWDIETGFEEIRMSHESRVNAVAISPDGKYILSGSGNPQKTMDYSARLWDAYSGKELKQILHDRAVLAVAFSQDGSFFVTGGCGRAEKTNDLICIDGTARVWKTVTGKEQARILTHQEVKKLSFSRDDRYVITGADEAWLWHTDDLIDEACRHVISNLTREEWKQYLESWPIWLNVAIYLGRPGQCSR